MAKRKDITGYVVPETGTTVLRFVEMRNHNAYWECKCGVCGKTYVTRGSDVTYGNSKTCGHCFPYKKDLTGYIIPETGTTVIRFVEMHNNDSMWECKCGICGNLFITRSADISNGHTKSCGCYQRIQHKKAMTEKIGKYIKDLTGQKFGKLTAIQPTDQRNSNRAVIWECKCDCGETAYVSSVTLLRGQISCGKCIGSKGELKIADILTKNNIPFEAEKIFDTCKFTDTHKNARFDFYVNNKYIIEYDGLQHFKEYDEWVGKNGFEKIKSHDLFKNQWCKENDIPLIRIPYTHFDDIILEDLMLETSSFIVL